MSTQTPDTFVVRANHLPDAQKVDRPDLPKEQMGEPVSYWWKPLIRCGTYDHPDPRIGSVTFDRKTLEAADRHTREWIKDGGNPSIRVGHKGGENLGWIIDTKFDGNTVWGLHQLIGDDARRAAARHKTSVKLKREYHDASGKVYPVLIEHQALTPEPVDTGLGDFIAMSRGTGPDEMVAVLTSTDERTAPMLDQEQLAKVRDLLGQPDLSAEEAVPMMIGATEVALADVGDAHRDISSRDVELSRVIGERDDLARRLNEAESAVEMARNASIPRPTANEIYFASRALKAERDKAVRSGAIIPAIATRAEERYLRKAVDFNSITLSRAVEGDDHKLMDGMTRLLDFYETVQGNKPAPALGEETNAQAITMSRPDPNGAPPEQQRANPYESTIQALTAKP